MILEEESEWKTCADTCCVAIEINPNFTKNCKNKGIFLEKNLSFLNSQELFEKKLIVFYHDHVLSDMETRVGNMTAQVKSSFPPNFPVKCSHFHQNLSHFEDR